MRDAMVTARMPRHKKEAGNRILRELGYSASQAINELYDRILETGKWPLVPARAQQVDSAQLTEALAQVDALARVSPDEFVDMDMQEARRARLLAKGRAQEGDFA